MWRAEAPREGSLQDARGCGAPCWDALRAQGSKPNGRNAKRLGSREAVPEDAPYPSSIRFEKCSIIEAANCLLLAVTMPSSEKARDQTRVRIRAAVRISSI
jgi:hypothetical protein